MDNTGIPTGAVDHAKMPRIIDPYDWVIGITCIAFFLGMIGAIVYAAQWVFQQFVC